VIGSKGKEGLDWD